MLERERRAVDGGDVLGEVVDGAGAGEHHVAAGLVAGEAVGGLGVGRGAVVGEQEPERVVGDRATPAVELAALDQAVDDAPHAVRATRGTCARRTSPARRCRAPRWPGTRRSRADGLNGLCPTISTSYQSSPASRLWPSDVVPVVGRERLAGGEVAHQPVVLRGEQLGDEHLAGVVEVAHLHPVHEEEVDVIGAQPLAGSSPPTGGAASA